jgi:hypothetical protein
MIDPYSPLEKCRREFADDTAQKRAELYAAELRDRFAAAALSGMHAKNNYHPGISTPQERARLAYIDADAMMEEREKRRQVDMKARDHD